ncbi:MAG: glycosyltransferase family 4 protein [Gammaproteobacteria bacterium]
MKIALISDAWRPQINGVVTTLSRTCETLIRLGHTVELITPGRFRTYPCPGYPEVGLAFLCGPRLRPILKSFKPDAIHLATESPIGFAARRYCRECGIPYTTSYHSRFPEYFKLRLGLPLLVSYGYLRWFHSESARVMVATESLREELAGRGFKRLALWSRGVDTVLFKPGDKTYIQDKRPVFMYVGRVAIEKNVEDFLKLDLPGSRYVIGDGPQRQELEEKYPETKFLGYRSGHELARYLSAADVMVFPSRNDTFGLVILEALASGVPVAAYPVPGPKDIIMDSKVGILDSDLKHAALKALALSPESCRAFACEFSWEKSVRQFVDNLALIDDKRVFD